MKSFSVIASLLSLLFIIGCEDDKSKLISGTGIFVLCEGEYGAPNASIWSIDWASGEKHGPVYWTTSNPLGDTGQSLKIHNDKLYIVVNNSHSVEIMNLENGDAVYEATLSVPNASPRFLEIVNDTGFLTSWGLSGILVFDIQTLDILDTINVNGWPEKILNTEWGLFVTIPMKSYTDYTDRVLVFDPDNYSTPIDSFSVVPGPIELLVSENSIYVASTSYDNSYNSYGGLSKINPVDRTVEKNDYGQIYGLNKNLLKINGQIFRLINSGLAKVNPDLSLDMTDLKAATRGAYSAKYLGSKLFIGASDYSAPDTVYVFTEDMVLDTLYQVKALPTDFDFYDPENEL